MKARVAALLTVVAATLLFSAAPAFAVGWTSPVALSPSVTAAAGNTIQADDASLAVNAAGAQVITWDDYEQGSDTRPCVSGEARTRVPGGDWSPTTQIGCHAKVRIGPGGTAIAFWEGADGLDAATAQAGSAFGSAQTVHADTTSHDGVVAAVDGTGRAALAWSRYTPIPGSPQYDLDAIVQNADGTWPASAQTLDVGYTSSAIPTDPYGSAPALAAGSNGDFVIAVNSFPPGGLRYVNVYTRQTAAQGNPGGNWVKNTILPGSTANTPRMPLVAADQNDRFTVMDAVQMTSTYKLYAWTRQANTTSWSSTPETVGAADGDVTYATAGLALDSAGNAQTAFIYSTDSTTYSVRGATRSAGSTTWSAGAPPEIGPTPCDSLNGGTPTPPSVAFDAAGNATVAFQCSSGAQMFTRPAGGSTFSTFTGPDGASNTQISTDPNGYLIATWTANGATYTSVYDPVPPTVDSVVPPAGAVAGQAATFTVSGSDVWGPVTYSVDFGDGSTPASGRPLAPGGFTGFARATAGNTVSHIYSSAGNYVAAITMRDGAGNSSTSTVPVAVGAAPAPPADPGPPPVQGLPDPVAGVSANLLPVSPVVLIKPPGAKKFVPLTNPLQVKMGSIIDTRKGRVRITIANGRGGFDTADFYQGVFKLTQPKLKAGQTWFANLYLFGGSFKGCPAAPRHPKVAAIGARKKASPKRSVRHLWGSGKGAFRTVGRFSSATIRGTTWLTDDRCNGTLTKVTAGKIGVRDFVRKKTIVVKKGHRYLAGPLPKKKR